MLRFLKTELRIDVKKKKKTASVTQLTSRTKKIERGPVFRCQNLNAHRHFVIITTLMTRAIYPKLYSSVFFRNSVTINLQSINLV